MDLCRQARLGLHTALLLSFLTSPTAESHKPPSSRLHGGKCQDLHAQSHHTCLDAPPASGEAVSRILLQKSSSVVLPHKHSYSPLREVLELANSAQPADNQKIENKSEEVEEKAARVEDQPDAGELKNPNRRDKKGQSSLEAYRQKRPHAGDKPESIEFGVYLKQLHSINFAKDTFSCDLILTLRWKDKRARKVLPEDDDSVTLPTELARSHIWLPDVVVTNRALKSSDIISSSVTVSSSGRIVKTERILVVILGAFDVRSFPFDTQTLHVRVASATYMADELELSALGHLENPESSGIKADIFNISGFEVNSVNLQTYEETDGSLKKSRGSLDISIARNYMPLVASVIVPNILLLALSWSVFFFPMLPSFIMPRVSTSLISLLSSMTLSLRTHNLLPPKKSGYVWIEFFEESIELLIFITVCLNILLALTCHEWELEDLAKRMNAELRWGYGLMIFIVCMLWLWGYWRRNEIPDGLALVVYLTRLLLFAFLLCHIVFSIFVRTRRARKYETLHDYSTTYMAAPACKLVPGSATGPIVYQNIDIPPDIPVYRERGL